MTAIHELKDYHSGEYVLVEVYEQRRGKFLFEVRFGGRRVVLSLSDVELAIDEQVSDE